MNFEIRDVFYNVIPGGFFVILWVSVFNRINDNLIYNFIKESNSDFYLGIIFLILAVFVGFFLQGLWRMLAKESTKKLIKRRKKVRNMMILTHICG